MATDDDYRTANCLNTFNSQAICYDWRRRREASDHHNRWHLWCDAAAVRLQLTDFIPGFLWWGDFFLPLGKFFLPARSFFSSGDIFRGDIFPGDIFRGGFFPGRFFPGRFLPNTFVRYVILCLYMNLQWHIHPSNNTDMKNTGISSSECNIFKRHLSRLQQKHMLTFWNISLTWNDSRKLLVTAVKDKQLLKDKLRVLAFSIHAVF